MPEPTERERSRQRTKHGGNSGVNEFEKGADIARAKAQTHTHPSGNTVTVICFKCEVEKFRPEIMREGNRRNKVSGEWERWFLCKDCYKDFAEKNRGKNEAGQWIKTTMGWILMGPQGSPSDAGLNARRKQRRWLGEGRGA